MASSYTYNGKKYDTSANVEQALLLSDKEKNKFVEALVNNGGKPLSFQQLKDLGIVAKGFESTLLNYQAKFIDTNTSVLGFSRATSKGVGGTGANWNLSGLEKDILLNEIQAKGRALTDDELMALNLLTGDGNKPGTDRFTNLQQAMNQMITSNKDTLGFDAPAWNLDVSGTGANWNLTETEKLKLIDAIKANGGPLNRAQLSALGLLEKNGKARVDNIVDAQTAIIDNNATRFGFDSAGNQYDTETGQTNEGVFEDTIPTDPKEQAFAAYYNDIYSLKPGTGGADMLGRLEKSYDNQAKGALSLIDSQFQSQAMQQAQTVKAITDQVRAERMSRLRAGMSESQIANQDMQMLMANVGAVNENAALASQGRLEAQVGVNTAKDVAYTDYLKNADARGQNAAAMYAADSGNAYWNTIQNMRTKYGTDASKWTTAQWDTERKTTVGLPTTTS